MTRTNKILLWLPLFAVGAYFWPFPLRIPAPVSGAPVLDWGGAVCERHIHVAIGGAWLPQHVSYDVYRFSMPVAEPPDAEQPWIVKEASRDWSWARGKLSDPVRADLVSSFNLAPGDPDLIEVNLVSTERIGLMGTGLLDRRTGGFYVKFFGYG